MTAAQINFPVITDPGSDVEGTVEKTLPVSSAFFGYRAQPAICL